MNGDRIAIVGAGLCGLAIASRLKALGRSPVVIEKSKGVGGRLATRRDAQATYDHGAAFYIAEDLQDLPWHSRWEEAGVSRLWFAEGHRRFYGGDRGMTSLAKDLAHDQTVHLNEKVVRLDRSETGLSLLCESGKTLDAEKVVLTCPLPQSLQILTASKMAFPKSLEEISYSQCLVGLFEIEPPPGFGEFSFLRPGGSIFSLANNQAKGLSEKLALTVVMSEAWSAEHFDLDEAQISQQMTAELTGFFQVAFGIGRVQVKKWRYNRPHRLHPETFLALQDLPVVLAGDAFGGGSISGTLHSAEAAFQSFLREGVTNEEEE